MARAVGDPTQLLVGLNHGVVGIHQDYLVELVLAVFTNPVGVEDLKVGIPPAYTFFGNPLDRFGHCDLLDSCIGWLPLHVDFSLPEPSSPYSGSNEDYTLFGLVAHAPGCIDAGRALNPLEDSVTPP